MARDLQALAAAAPNPAPDAWGELGDARDLSGTPADVPIAGVCCSPPYPNEHCYTRMARLELVLTGLLQNRQDLRAIKERSLRSNSRNIFAGDQDDQRVAHIPSVQVVHSAVEARLSERLAERGHVSGFERTYPRIVPLFFGGLAAHLPCLRARLLPGAVLAYVIGNQATHYRVPVKAAAILADVARDLGYAVDGIERWRSRYATTSHETLDENILWLRWDGGY